MKGSLYFSICLYYNFYYSTFWNIIYNTNQSKYSGYDRHVNRYFSSQNQEQALNLSEKLDYTNLIQSKGLTVSGEVRFINTYTLNFIDFYAYSHKNGVHLTLNYIAWMYNYKSVQIKKEANHISILSDGIDFCY